ncbi:MAG: hypothetical protein ABI446_07400 [Gemmatimonadaceae bacterium]
MTHSPPAPPRAVSNKRFVYGVATGVAVAFMGTVALLQLRENGARGIQDGRFIGFDIAVGLIAFRSGMVIARGYERLSRPMRERRRKNS